MIQTQKEIDSINNTCGLDLELAQKRCIKHFGFIYLNNKKINTLFLINAYKICGPGYISCGIGPTIHSDEEYHRYRKRLNKAQDAYNNYIDSTLFESISESFSSVKREELTGFYHVSNLIIQEVNMIEENFPNIACDYAQKDTLLMKLYSDINKARFSEL